MKTNEIEILLVEDNENDAEMTLRSFKKNNISNQVTRLKNGAEAIDFLFATGTYSGRDINNRPRVILLDLKMPKVNGIEVLEKIKADEKTKRIPVVMFTSSKEYPDIERCYELGANSYIVKPVEFDNYINIMRDIGLYWLALNQSAR